MEKLYEYVKVRDYLYRVKNKPVFLYIDSNCKYLIYLDTMEFHTESQLSREKGIIWHKSEVDNCIKNRILKEISEIFPEFFL